MGQVREIMGKAPVTHKIERPFFRNKATSYGRLQHYLPQLGKVPSPAVLAAQTSKIVRWVFNIQKDFGVSLFLTPPLYTQPSDFERVGALTQFSVSRLWVEQFLTVATEDSRPKALSLCIHVECLRKVAARREIDSFIRQIKPKAIYLMLVEFDLGKPDLDQALFSFLDFARASGVDRIIWSCAPPWIHFLEPRGVTDFVTGINIQNSLKVEHLERDSDDMNVPHNYWVPKRFCRMAPPQAAGAVAKGLIDPCPCSVCTKGVPTAKNPIREHYLYARTAECAEFRAAPDLVRLLRERAAETTRFITRANAEDIKILNEPNPTLWCNALPK